MVVGTTRDQVWFIRCLNDAWTRHVSGGQIGNGTISDIGRLVGRVMVLAGSAGTCLNYLLLPLQSFFSLRKWNNRNELPFARMHGRPLLFPRS